MMAPRLEPSRARETLAVLPSRMLSTLVAERVLALRMGSLALAMAVPGAGGTMKVKVLVAQML